LPADLRRGSEGEGDLQEVRSTSKSEVIQAYERYLEAFLGDDVAAIDALVQYPLAYIGDGKVSMLDQWPFQPSALRAAKGWHTSVDMAYEVVGISETKAHVVLKRCTRVRRDGSPIENVFVFYAWTRTESGWKMFALSDVTVPY
jgi:hypothetical protein